MAVIQWKTKTELQAGSLSGNAEIIGTEDLPILTVFDQDVSSADTDIVVSYTQFTLSTSEPHATNLIPEDPTPFDLKTSATHASNTIPVYQGDLESWRSVGKIQTLKSVMKCTFVV